MTEAELQAAVMELARSPMFGWRVAHFRPARTAHGWRTPVSGDGAGWPDLVLVHRDPDVLLVRELKAARGKVAPDQRRWLDDLEAVGVDVGVWRPDDWSAIVDTLTFGRTTPGARP